MNYRLAFFLSCIIRKPQAARPSTRSRSLIPRYSRIYGIFDVLIPYPDPYYPILAPYVHKHFPSRSSQLESNLAHTSARTYHTSQPALTLELRDTHFHSRHRLVCSLWLVGLFESLAYARQLISILQSLAYFPGHEIMIPRFRTVLEARF